MTDIVIPTRRWQGDEPALESFPEPEVWARPARLAEIPKTARTLMALGTLHGWRVETTYARGTYATRSTARVVDSIAVRMRRGNLRLIGIWHDRKFHTGLAGAMRVNLATLRDWVTSNWLT
jgi:hypothetical protein